MEKHSGARFRPASLWRQAVLGHPWLVLLATTLLVAAAASGLQHLRFVTDYRAFFSPENPQLVEFELLQDTYSRQDNILFVFELEDGSVFEPDTLDLIERYTESAWEMPFTSRVDSITNYQHTYAEEDDLVVLPLVENALDLAPAAIDRIRDIAVNEPLLRDRLVSPDGTVTGINLTLLIPPDDQSATPRAVAAAREFAARIEGERPDIKVHLTGVVMINNQFLETSQADAKTLIPGMLVIVILMMAVILRDPVGVVATVLVIALSTAGAFGVAGWIGIDLTPPSVDASIVILTVGVADCVHILVQHYIGLNRGMNRDEALRRSLGINFAPVSLTSITTIIGFLSMNLSEVPPFRDLGNIVAIGVCFAYLLSLSFLPALVRVLPPSKARQRRVESGLMERLANFVIRRRHPLLVVSLVIAVALTAGNARNHVNDQYSKYFDESVEFRVATDFADHSLAGLYNIQYSLESGTRGGVSEPAYLQTVEEFANWLRRQPEVRHVQSYTDIMKRLNRNMHGDAPDRYRLPEQRDLAAQYLLLYELSLPFGLDLTNTVNFDKSATRMVVSTPTLGTPDMLGLQRRARDWLQENAPPPMLQEGSSPSLMFTHIGRRSMISSIKSATVALVLISLVLVFALGSLRVGLLSLVPNLLPIAAGFGAWGLTVSTVGMSLSLVAGMTIGIVVDDTVHFLSKYRKARRLDGASPEDAVRYAFRTVGMALVTTTVVLIAGFLVLAVSEFKINGDMGKLTAGTLLIALLADFFLLPPLLMLFDRARGRATANGHGVPRGQQAPVPPRS